MGPYLDESRLFEGGLILYLILCVQYVLFAESEKKTSSRCKIMKKALPIEYRSGFRWCSNWLRRH